MLTDGVFAIALTLLAFDLHLPDVAEHESRLVLLGRLVALWPRLLAFVQSFAILALYWALHHHLARHLRRADGPLVWLHLAFLLTIAMQPFPTAVVGAHFLDPAAAILYGGSLVLTNGCFWAIWGYATTDRRLVRPDLSPRLVRHYHRLLGAPTLLFGLLVLAGVWDLRFATRAPLVLTVAAAYLLAIGYLLLGLRGFLEPRHPIAPTATGHVPPREETSGAPPQ